MMLKQADADWLKSGGRRALIDRWLDAANVKTMNCRWKIIWLALDQRRVA